MAAETNNNVFLDMTEQPPALPPLPRDDVLKIALTPDVERPNAPPHVIVAMKRDLANDTDAKTEAPPCLYPTRAEAFAHALQYVATHVFLDMDQQLVMSYDYLLAARYEETKTSMVSSAACFVTTGRSSRRLGTTDSVMFCILELTPGCPPSAIPDIVTQVEQLYSLSRPDEIKAAVRALIASTQLASS
jgi:hypothetical protein